MMQAYADEDVLNDMPQPSTFAASGALLHPAPFLVALAGMDEPLSWPLGAAQAKQIAALYPDTKIIPSSDIAIDQRYFQRYDEMLTAVYQGSIQSLVSSGEADMVLSHMVVDDVGDAESFRLRPTADEAICATTFGVLIILLPSRHEGGVVTFTYGDDSLAFDDAIPLIDTAYAAAYLSTTITSAPITSGRRVALVYRVYLREGSQYFVPPTLDPTIAALKVLGTSPFETLQRIGLEVSIECDSFDSFSIIDATFVEALVATGCFDVGLADLKIDGRESKCTIETLLPHPACNLPAVVVRNCVGKTIQGFLYTAPSGDSESTARAIVFWPKRHRPEDDANETEPDYLGVADTRELVLAAMYAFDLENASLTRRHYNRRAPSFLVLMEHFLMALNDVELTAVFLSNHITIQPKVPLVDIAPLVHHLLTKHGWEPLCAALLRLVQRWIQTEANDTLQLLTSLAGLNKAKAMHVWGRSHVFIEEVLVLEHYVQVTAPQLQGANYMSQRLPLPFVTVIDAYLFPRYDYLYTSYTDAAVLFLASLTQRLDAALFDACVAVGVVALFRVIAAIYPQLADSAPLRPLALAYVDAVIETLARDTAWPEWLPRPTEEDRDWIKVGAVIFLDVLHLVEQLAPQKSRTVTSAWLAALPTTRDALHRHRLPVLARLDTSSPVHRLLATAAIDRWTHLPPLPVVTPDFALPPPEDLDPQHCHQCGNVHALYTQADTLTLSCGSDGLCSTLSHILEADHAHVAVRRPWTQGEGYKIEKLAMPGPLAEWRTHARQVQIRDSVTASIETVKSQMRDKDDQEQGKEETDAPLAKRVCRA
ncbi:hypothetical protein SDRG_02570 [Saprolegnia diclina VS20]|uniref:Uncharacterized protein n=1 Tax=Saprolegnia diclina (strain VS20) TaxID=1156394 RepID=T0QP84_SAPDV|nr:hypothetical protein SDRG_02570 [Saprolegnia diclina VS20]EQC39914.1 hypothetical protein SDRG_02570 [Saprolegnia diclina VS20]|eukprot:XP_008606388.1 hypothetical protein SDRG_02570 [Saprolegnia diclina VS20]